MQFVLASMGKSPLPLEISGRLHRQYLRFDTQARAAQFLLSPSIIRLFAQSGVRVVVAPNMLACMESHPEIKPQNLSDMFWHLAAHGLTNGKTMFLVQRTSIGRGEPAIASWDNMKQVFLHESGHVFSKITKERTGISAHDDPEFAQAVRSDFAGLHPATRENLKKLNATIIRGDEISSAEVFCDLFSEHLDGTHRVSGFFPQSRVVVEKTIKNAGNLLKIKSLPQPQQTPLPPAA